jgi:Flp pilus assembly protein TadG
MRRRFYRHSGKHQESGQTLAMVVLVLGIFLMGAVAFSVDYSNVYFHRQNAQNAADAACTAGVMDLLANSQGNTLGNFPANSPPNSFQCSSNTTAAPCKYATLNGYSTPGLSAGTPSNDVRISFPSSVPGVTPPPSSLAAYPFLQVDVTDRVPTWFAGLVSGGRTVDVGARAICALQQAHAPVPIIVLNPSCTQAFDVSGSASVTIVGGPSRSIQVNSNNQSCAAATTASGSGCAGSGTIDLTYGGPTFNGGSFGVFGAPATAPGGFSGGSTGSWSPGATPISDPYALVSAPAKPLTAAPAPVPVPYGVDGCPDHTKKCQEYSPGLYTTPIVVQNETAIFLPGVYYITGTNNDNCGSPSSCNTKPTGQCRYGLDVDSNGVVRPANDPIAGYSSGAMFYLSGASGAGSYGSVFFGSNAGNYGGRNVDAFTTSNFTCPGGSTPPSQLNLPSSIDGNVLLGQCTAGGAWVGATNNGQTETTGAIRGLIFFQDRANADVKGQASMQGGGGLVIGGNMYFHNCDSTGTGTGCSNPPTGYNAFLQLQGTPGAGTYVLGNITADSFVLSGNGGVAMALNPNAVYNVLKASLIQ